MTPEIILGPPGTGKTRSLLEEVEGELGRGTRPERIGYVSFTQRAAEEAATRAREKFGMDKDRLPHFRTLHSMCYRALGLRSGDVLEGRALDEFARSVGVRITGRVSQDGTTSGFDRGDRLLFMENLSRVRCLPLRRQYDQGDDGLSWAEVSRFSRALAEFKEERKLLDYTDMLARALTDEARLPELDVLAVDESQDLSEVQWRVVERVAARARRVLIAGDDDQAIYKWAGADPERLISMTGDVRVLGKSWRVPRAIQALASRVLTAVKHRRPKEWSSREAEGTVDRARSFEHVRTDGESVLVLARNTYVIREQIIPELRRRGEIYEYLSHPSVRAGVLEAITTWERLRRGQSVTAAEARQTYEFMSADAKIRRGFKKLPGLADEELVSLLDLRQRGGLLTEEIWHDALDRVPATERSYLLTALRGGQRLRGRPRIRVSTIHGSKGGEADHVILMKEMAGRTHREMRAAPEDEARVWYVAATRARERLTIVESSTAQRCPWI
jgi:ATP-dependent DNA helicase UvrD/PcrA